MFHPPARTSSSACTSSNPVAGDEGWSRSCAPCSPPTRPYDTAFRARAARSARKPIACRDNSGFVVNRLLVPYLLDAIRALEEGVASVEDIDKGDAARLRLSHGGRSPCSTSSALDTNLLHRQHHVEEYREEALRGRRRSSSQMVQAGPPGQERAGRGFYEHAAQEVGSRGSARLKGTGAVHWALRAAAPDRKPSPWKAN